MPSHDCLDRQKTCFWFAATESVLVKRVFCVACRYFSCQNNNLFCCWDLQRRMGWHRKLAERECRCLNINKKTRSISWYDKWRTMLYILKGCASCASCFYLLRKGWAKKHFSQAQVRLSWRRYENHSILISTHGVIMQGFFFQVRWDISHSDCDSLCSSYLFTSCFYNSAPLVVWHAKKLINEISGRIKETKWESFSFCDVHKESTMGMFTVSPFFIRSSWMAGGR